MNKFVIMNRTTSQIVVIVLGLIATYLVVSLAINEGNPIYYLIGFLLLGSSINRIIVKLILKR